MGLTVDVDGLREAADGYTKYGEEFKTKVQPGVAKGALPATAIPIVDMGFKDAYAQAWEALDLTTQALGGVLSTIGLALTRVANTYQHKEAENTKLFHGKPIPPPPAPTVHHMSSWPTASQWVIGSGEGAAAIGSIVGSSIALAKASLPFGVSFLAVEGLLFTAAVLNFRDPVPYFTAATGWGEAREVVNEAAAKVPQLMNNVVYRGGWSGAGKDAFYACINNDIGPAMAAMKDLNNDMQIACRDGGIALGLSLVSYLAGTITAATMCETVNAAAAAASATVAGAPAAAAAATSAVTITLIKWIEFVGELFVELASVVGGLALAASTIGQGYDSLHAYLSGKGDQLEAGSVSLRPGELTTIQDPKNWQDPGAK